MKKRITVFLLLALLMSAWLTPALAVQTDFEYLSERKDIVIQVSWPTEQPGVTFLAPDGTVYDPMAETENTVTVLGENTLYYVIYDAPAGQWKIDYDKRGNREIQVSLFDYVPGVSIEELTLEPIRGNNLELEFLVRADTDRTVSYRLSMVGDDLTGERELDSGDVRTNRSVSRTLDLSGLASYSDYRIKLHVWYFDGSTEIFDQVFSDPFSYTNTSVTSSMTDFTCIVEPDTALIQVNWPELESRAQSVMVAVFENNDAEPVVYHSFAPDDGGAQLSYDPSAESIRVEVSVEKNGVYTAALTKTAVFADCGITLADPGATNVPQLRLDYTDMDGEAVFVTANGATTELIFTDDGNVDVQLADGWNDVSVRYTDADTGITWQLTRQVYVDREAPVLRLSENYDGMVTSLANLDIMGSVTDAAVVTINGTAVTVGSDGGFLHTVTLTAGENQLAVTAADALGNESRYTAVITCTDPNAAPGADTPGGGDSSGDGTLSRLFHPSSWLWLVVTGVLCLLVILYALIFWRRKTGGTER